MIELMEDLPAGVVGARASGQVSGEDYRDVLVPAVEAALARSGHIRFLYHIGPEFRKFTTTALWEDARVGLHHLGGFERIALVTDVSWIRLLAEGLRFAAPTELRVFANADLPFALEWIRG
jgi:hypothetical protein